MKSQFDIATRRSDHGMRRGTAAAGLKGRLGPIDGHRHIFIAG